MTLSLFDDYGAALRRMALCALVAWPLLAQATDSSAPPAGQAQRFAEVAELHGEVTATAPSGSTRTLAVGDSIHVGERIQTAAGSEAVLRTADAGIIAVRPGSVFVAERFAAEGKKTDHQALRLVSGSLRVISGWIGQLNRDGHRVVTTTATIGIRGTDHEPYLLPAEKASALYPKGLYDKVNRGATQLDARGGSVGIDSGKVGFARDPGAGAGELKTRTLMTLLLPVVLDRIPDFFVPGRFDRMLDQASAEADSNALRQLRAIGGEMPSTAAPQPADAQTLSPPPPDTPEPEPPAIVGCPPEAIGQRWLVHLDRAMLGRDARGLLALFSPNVAAKATVLSGGNRTTLEFDRNEMVRSTLASIASLGDYRQQRFAIVSAFAPGETADTCRRITVKSVVVEQGIVNERPFRFEAEEEYLLERQGDDWLAIQAHSRQR